MCFPREFGAQPQGQRGMQGALGIEQASRHGPQCVGIGICRVKANGAQEWPNKKKVTNYVERIKKIGKIKGKKKESRRMRQVTPTPTQRNNNPRRQKSTM